VLATYSYQFLQSKKQQVYDMLVALEHWNRVGAKLHMQERMHAWKHRIIGIIHDTVIVMAVQRQDRLLNASRSANCTKHVDVAS
jgi:hypothetical protein